MVLFTRTIGIVLLLVATSCRTTPDNPPEPVEPAAYIDLSQPEEDVAELDVEVEETIDIGEDGLCHDGIIADYLIKKFRKENPTIKMFWVLSFFHHLTLPKFVLCTIPPLIFYFGGD